MIPPSSPSLSSFTDRAHSRCLSSRIPRLRETPFFAETSNSSISPHIFLQPIAAHCGPCHGPQVAFKTPLFTSLFSHAAHHGPQWAACLGCNGLQWAAMGCNGPNKINGKIHHRGTKACLRATHRQALRGVCLNLPEAKERFRTNSSNGSYWSKITLFFVASCLRERIFLSILELSF